MGQLGRGVPPPEPTRESGRVLKAPQQGLWAEPWPKMIFVGSEDQKTHLMTGISMNF